jgi:hypothetical protein
MNKLVPLVLAVVAWGVFGTWAEARRSALQKDSPALKPGIEADLAARHCPDLRIDPERFREFSHANHLNHADFFTRKRSVALQQEIDVETILFRVQPDRACARMWDKYGTAGTVMPLLARRS